MKSQAGPNDNAVKYSHILTRGNTMTNNLAMFNFEDQNIRVLTVDEAIWFVAKDVASALGFKDTVKAVSTHCKNAKPLNAIGRAIRPPYIDQQLDSQLKLIPESDVFRLIMRSNLETAEKFQDLVCEEILPTIRKTGKYEANTPNLKLEESVKLQLLIAERAGESLRLADTAKVRMYRIIGQEAGLSTNFLPSYVEEDAVDSLTNLLKAHGVSMSAVQMNKHLFSEGYLKQMSRESKSKGEKLFWNITDKGLKYGKNETNPNNPRETQPLWYRHKFAELLEKVLPIISQAS